MKLIKKTLNYCFSCSPIIIEKRDNFGYSIFHQIIKNIDNEYNNLYPLYYFNNSKTLNTMKVFDDIGFIYIQFLKQFPNLYENEINHKSLWITFSHIINELVLSVFNDLLEILQCNNISKFEKIINVDYQFILNCYQYYKCDNFLFQNEIQLLMMKVYIYGNKIE